MTKTHKEGHSVLAISLLIFTGSRLLTTYSVSLVIYLLFSFWPFAYVCLSLPALVC